MTQPCTLCKSGARGDIGHPALREEFRSGMQPNGEATYILFSCVICGSRWGRGRNLDWAPKSFAAVA